MIRLHNSLTNNTEELTPLQPGHVRMYSCGPTVYNNLHIGNLSAFIYADVLRRILVASGLKVTHVMNITDVDDKTIRDSRRDYPNADPLTALQTLTTKYTDVFMKDLHATGNDVGAIQFISAVDSIPEMITLTQRLIDAGFAYIATNGVYFSIEKYVAAGHTYGLLQHVQIDGGQARVAHDEYDKDNASDFALWKAAEKGEPSWQATFTSAGQTVAMPGRPGWHIECSAMSEKLLGVPFDIHTGGIDLKFPHHENEIAQTCGAGSTGGLATIFVHNNHILVDGRKMSKSLGNFYTLRDIEEMGFTPQAFRLLVLQSHYASESNFSWDTLTQATTTLSHMQRWADLRHQSFESDSLAKLYDDAWTDILGALQDNVRVPQALAHIHELIQKVGTLGPDSRAVASLVSKIDSALGLELGSSPALTSEQSDLVTQRATARERKDWAQSDSLREQLSAQGIGINDSSFGQIWYRL